MHFFEKQKPFFREQPNLREVGKFDYSSMWSRENFTSFVCGLP